MEDFESYFCFDCTKKHPFLIQKPDTWISLGISNGNEKIHQWVTPITTGQKRKLDQIDIDDTINDDHETNKKSKEEQTDELKQSSSSCKQGNKINSF